MDETATNPVMSKERVTEVARGVYTIGGMGNALAILTANGVIQVDAGNTGRMAPRMIGNLRQITDLPVLAIVYSHGHMGYNFGMQAWLDHAAERGDPAPRLIAHERLPVRYRRYLETMGLQDHLNSMQFRDGLGSGQKPEWYVFPTETFRDSLVIDGGDRMVEVFAAPSETDDSVALWVDDVRLIYGGPAVIKSIPNVGTPLRSLRDPMRWADTLEKILARDPAIVVPEFGKPMTDKAEFTDALGVAIRALRWLRAEVVSRMNRGMTDVEIIHDLDYPDDLFGHRWMKWAYGHPDYIVRDIYRAENGWWTTRNATDLHPAAPQAAAAAVLSAITDRAAVLARARGLQAAGEFQLALHVIDLLALADDGSDEVRAAKALKADLLVALSERNPSFVSRNLYLSCADRMRPA